MKLLATLDATQDQCREACRFARTCHSFEAVEDVAEQGECLLFNETAWGFDEGRIDRVCWNKEWAMRTEIKFIEGPCGPQLHVCNHPSVDSDCSDNCPPIYYRGDIRAPSHEPVTFDAEGNEWPRTFVRDPEPVRQAPQRREHHGHL